MRLDKFLKVSRLIKRRTVANEACDNARVTVNGRPAKASYDVKPGDVLRIAFGQRTLAVEVLAVADAVRKDDAAAMYSQLPEKFGPHWTSGRLCVMIVHCYLNYFVYRRIRSLIAHGKADRPAVRRCGGGVFRRRI